MTSRTKNAVRIETEIEKSREESNWKKVIDLAEQLKSRSPNYECLSNFLIGEGKLESYLEECAPVKEHYDKSKAALGDAKKYLELAANENGKKAGVALDAHLLLGKLNYACGNYEASLKNYMLAELHTLTEKELPIRSLRIVAESYAIKGLCLEQSSLPGSSRFKIAERETDMINCYELASDLTLLYLQNTSSSNVQVGPILETALQRAPILHMRAERLQRAVDRYREMLSAVESQATQTLRLTLTRQLAEVLLRGVSGTVYTAPERISSNQGTLTRKKENDVTEGPWKPKKYTGLNQFIPRNECEEIILLLLIGEAMAVRDAVLSQSPEFQEARLRSYENATAIYDLLTIATIRWGQACLLNESLERAMKFSFGEPHVWRQRALCCAISGTPSLPFTTPNMIVNNYKTHVADKNISVSAVRAKSVLSHATTLRPNDSTLSLLASKTCYQLGWIEDGLKFSKAAMRVEKKEPTFMFARCHLYVGIGYQMKAQSSNVKGVKQSCNSKCAKHFLKAAEADPNDHLALYYLALQYAFTGMQNEAMDAVRASLAARGDAVGALRLAVALWGRGGAARGAASLARAQHPACTWLAAAQAQLHLRWGEGEAALAIGKDLLTAFKMYDAMEAEQMAPYHELDSYSDTKSVLYVPNDVDSNKDANSIRAASVGASRVERALSDVVSSVSSPRGRLERATSMVASYKSKAWLLLAELYLGLERASAAAGCVAEASALAPFSHQVMHMRGMVHAFKEEYEEARQCFQNAIAIHPTYVDSVVELGVCHHRLGWYRLAEKVLRDAAHLEPSKPDIWKKLGLVLESLGEHEAAADSMATALELELTSPVIPFSSLPYVFE